MNRIQSNLKRNPEGKGQRRPPRNALFGIERRVHGDGVLRIKSKKNPNLILNLMDRKINISQNLTLILRDRGVTPGMHFLVLKKGDTEMGSLEYNLKETQIKP